MPIKPQILTWSLCTSLPKLYGTTLLLSSVYGYPVFDLVGEEIARMAMSQVHV